MCTPLKNVGKYLNGINPLFNVRYNHCIVTVKTINEKRQNWGKKGKKEKVKYQSNRNP